MDILNKILKGNTNTELLWAEYLKLSISDKPWLKSLAFHPGRWAGNFTFFFLLNRILTLTKPKSILEFGLGESTRFINSYLQNEFKETHLKVIEHDIDWIECFQTENELSKRVTIEKLELTNIKYRGCNLPAYEQKGLNQIDLNDNFKKINLAIIDGPFGSKKKFSRVDILELINNYPKNFVDTIFIVDDTNRKGERNTLKEIVKLNQDYLSINYHGSKSVGVAVPAKHKFLLSL